MALAAIDHPSHYLSLTHTHTQTHSLSLSLSLSHVLLQSFDTFQIGLSLFFFGQFVKWTDGGDGKNRKTKKLAGP